MAGMYADQPDSVNRVFRMATDLVQNLRGHGTPLVTAKGKTADGVGLAVALRALRDEIDDFLARG
jgi:hypothetical protein